VTLCSRDADIAERRVLERPRGMIERRERVARRIDAPMKTFENDADAMVADLP
jgi:hypothetical protein